MTTSLFSYHPLTGRDDQAAVGVGVVGAAVVGAGAAVVGAGAAVVGAGAAVVGAGAAVVGAGAAVVGAGAAVVGAGAGVVGTGAGVVGLGAGVVGLGAGVVGLGAGVVGLGAGVVGLGAGVVGLGAGVVGLGAVVGVTDGEGVGEDDGVVVWLDADGLGLLVTGGGLRPTLRIDGSPPLAGAFCGTADGDIAIPPVGGEVLGEGEGEGGLDEDMTVGAGQSAWPQAMYPTLPALVWGAPVVQYQQVTAMAPSTPVPMVRLRTVRGRRKSSSRDMRRRLGDFPPLVITAPYRFDELRLFYRHEQQLCC